MRRRGGQRVRERCRGLHLTPVLPGVLRAKVTAFVELFVQSQELQRSLESITALNAALRDSDIRTQAVLDNVADGIFILDEGGLIESVNRSVGRLFGYHASEPVGHPFAFMIAPERRHEFRGLEIASARIATRRHPGQAIETLGCRQDGSTFAMELERGEMQHGERASRSPPCATSPSARRRPRRSSTWRSTTASPASPTAPCSSDLLSRTLASAKRAEEPRAVLVMDLDGFKQVNDTLGHDRGDNLLKQVGERLCRDPARGRHGRAAGRRRVRHPASR